jgi:transposase
MTKIRKKRDKTKRSFPQLTKKTKQKILDWIVQNDAPIREATEHFNVTYGTINKIFEERFQPPKWTDDYTSIKNENE